MKNTPVPQHGSNVPREQIPSAYQWRTQDIFASTADWQTAVDSTRAQLPQLAQLQGTLKNNHSILQCLTLRDTIAQSLEKIYPYARLQRDVDNGNSQWQELVGQAEVLLAEYAKAVSFLEPELLALPASTLQALAADPSAAAYAHYLHDLLRLAPHVLEARDEELLAKSQLATAGSENAFRAFTGADISFPPALDSQGQEHSVSEGSYLLNMSAPDRTLRENTFTQLMSTYRRYRNTLATTLTGKARSSLFYATAHNYTDTLSATLAGDNISPELYSSLIDTIHQGLPALHEYMELKRTALQVEQLHPYDIYLPLTSAGGDTFHFTFEEACTNVQQALAPLGSCYLQALQEGLSQGWIDVYENQGKRSGAYSWGVYGVHPYVMLNFQPRYNSVSTLAHEMGHALHSYFSNQTQPFPTADYTIFCAEVASTTNEIFLLEYMLKQATREQKIYLLNQYLEAVRTTVYRQVQFAEFEQTIHAKVTQGQTLTADYLDKLWHQLNTTYYGPSFTVDALLDSEWSRIPHFYTPFYVYKYATGYSAATAFAHNILSGNAAARDKYLGFLQAGGSDYPLDILQSAGVDFTGCQPVSITLQGFQAKLTELKELLK